MTESAHDLAGRTALDLAMSTQWAMLPEMVETVLAIAKRDNAELLALMTRSAKPMRGGRLAVVRDGGVAVVPVAGPIFRRANLFTEISGATSTDVLAKDIQAALDDPEIRSLVLDIDSPGGAVPGIAELADLIYAARGTKPITAYVSGSGASAAYWLASAADRIVVEPTAHVGSIGVVGIVRKPNGKDDEVEFVSSQSPRKRIDPTAEDGRAEIQSLIDDTAAVFVRDVARFRGVDEETVLSEYGQGGVMVGARAMAAGMVDALGSLESVIAGAAGARGDSMSKQTTNDVPAVTREQIAADYPAIADAFRAEGADQARTETEASRAEALAVARREGAESERARIRGVLEQSIPGHEAMIQGLAFDGETTPEMAAVAVVKAERAAGSDYLEGRRKAASDAPVVPVVHSATGVEEVDPHDEDALRAAYDRSPKLRDEFVSADAFVAFKRAEAAGRVRLRRAV